MLCLSLILVANPIALLVSQRKTCFVRAQREASPPRPNTILVANSIPVLISSRTNPLVGRMLNQHEHTKAELQQAIDQAKGEERNVG
jgi:hypothetical protein